MTSVNAKILLKGNRSEKEFSTALIEKSRLYGYKVLLFFGEEKLQYLLRKIRLMAIIKLYLVIEN